MPLIHNIKVGEQVPVPYIVDRFSDLDLLVIGCSANVWSDVEKAHKFHNGHTMAVNRMILDYQYPLEHCISCHPYSLVLFTLYRRFEMNYYSDFYTHSCGMLDQLSYEEYLIPQFIWDFPEYWYGTTALTAVLAGLLMGYKKIILAGVPLDTGGCYYNPLWKFNYSLDNGDKTMENWGRAAKECFHGKVKSLSGNTRELLGEP